MKIYSLNTLGDLHDPELCILDQSPDGIGVKYSRLIRGRAIAAEFPTDAVVQMSPDRTGLRLGTLIGNTKRFLILHRDAKDLIAAEFAARGDRWPIEYLPFTVVNHKGRPHSGDYFFVNPVGTIDCVDHTESQIEYFNGNPNKVMEIRRLVLDPDKLGDIPPLFRLPQAEDRYFLDQGLKARLDGEDFTNLLMSEVEVRAS